MFPKLISRFNIHPYRLLLFILYIKQFYLYNRDDCLHLFWHYVILFYFRFLFWIASYMRTCNLFTLAMVQPIQPAGSTCDDPCPVSAKYIIIYYHLLLIIILYYVYNNNTSKLSNIIICIFCIIVIIIQTQSRYSSYRTKLYSFIN